jgi:hypothetical protein
MVGTHIPLLTNSQLASNINISFGIDFSTLRNLLHTLLISLPNTSAVNTFHSTRLTSLPLLKAVTVDVLSTSSFAPDDIFTFFEFHYANWTIPFDWLTATTCVCG